VVFCSKGDNITPPPQALEWILDLYEDVDEIRSHGQTIVYTVHENVGHLGIFVSGGVARKEHGELSSNIDLIDTLPPGLYEAVFESKTADTAGSDLVSGEWVMRCEARTLDDIRKLGANSDADDRCFAAVANISQINLSLYRRFMQPAVRAMSSEDRAKWMRRCHPLRLQYEMFSDANPFMAHVGRMARWVEQHRSPAKPDNPLLHLQETVSKGIVSWLDFVRDTRDRWAEQTFFAVYGSPALQALAGINSASDQPMRRAGKSPLHQELLHKRIAELKAQIPAGGIREATVRALLFIGMERGCVDERGFEMIRRIRSTRKDIQPLPLSEFKALVREQYLMLLLDTEASLAAIPAMLPPEPEFRQKAIDLIKQVLTARGEIHEDVAVRFERIGHLFRTHPDRPVLTSASSKPRAVESRIAS
jgi:Protein of unknown function (DUF3141)